MMNDNAKEQLRTLLEDGALKEALDLLQQMARQKGNRHLRSGSTILTSRFSKNEKDNDQGVLSREDYLLERNQTLRAALDFLDGKEPEGKAPVHRNRYLWGALVLALIAVLVMAWSMFSQPFHQTVYVRGIGSDRPIVLEDQGVLSVDLGNDPKEAPIEKKGQVIFKEIPVKFKGKSFPVYFQDEKYVLVEPKKNYRFSGKPIYVEVEIKKELRTIKGMVKNRDGTLPIRDVQVLVTAEGEPDTITLTNETGYFELELPEHMYREEYTVKAVKEGYRSDETKYYAHGTAMIPLRLSRQ